jgi:hypothetical protein
MQMCAIRSAQWGTTVHDNRVVGHSDDAVNVGGVVGAVLSAGGASGQQLAMS